MKVANRRRTWHPRVWRGLAVACVCIACSLRITPAQAPTPSPTPSPLGASVCPPATPPVPASTTAPAPQLFVSATEVNAGDTIQVLIVLPDKNAAKELKGSLKAPGGATIWLPDANHRCQQSTASTNYATFALAPFDEENFCVQFPQAGVFRLTGTLAATGFDSIRFQSEPIKVTSFVLNPTIWGIISALVGFFAGILSHGVQKIVEDKLAQRKVYADADQALLSTLGPEL